MRDLTLISRTSNKFDKEEWVQHYRHPKVKTLLKKFLELAALCLLVSFTPRIQAQNGLLREVYSNVCCGIDGLLNDPNYPGNPSIVGTIPNFEAPANFADQYGQRVRGYLLAPQTGNYTFWIASDDQSQLFISGDEQSTLLTKIAEVFGATGAGDYEREPNQRSAPIRLEAGKYYYIEAIMVEGGGGDNLSVRWQLPDGTIEEPIPENRLFVELIGPQITRQPSNIKVTEAQSATFSVQFANLGPLAYQWERNGVAIPGETNLTLTLPSVKMSDSGSRYRLRASNQFGEAVSSEAVLTVNPDVTQPFIVSAQNAGENNLVTVTFSEPVDLLSAANRNNYSLSGGVVVLGASLDSSGRTVILRTTSLTFGTNYTITVNNIKDLAAQPNLIEPDTRIDFTYGYAPLNAGTVYGKSESPGPSSRRTGLVVSEIMYHPAPRSDGRNLQYIELYNSSEVLESIGGYRLTGAIDYTFPEGTFISKTNYLVVAASPLDVQSLYGLTRVYGPYANTLDDKGTIRLLNQQGAVMLEFEYDSKGAWPSAPDGAGPSLVLARPSYGEADPRAWAPGEFIGGTPGKSEPRVADPNRGLVINEFLAHTDDPQVDFIELYNYSANPIDLSGMFVTDSIETNRFQIPEGTIIQPLGFVSFDQNQLGFSLSASGERIILRNKQNNRVIDCIDFGPQANGISMGRYPDGAPEIKSLQRPTPALANARVLLPDIVINEIMYKSVSRNSDEDYVELFNRSTRAINLNGWRLEGGIGFTFTSSFTLNPGAYLVVAKNLDLLRTNNPGTLTTANSVGNFSGNLSNNGERIALSRPEAIVSTNSNGKAATNISYVVVNEVRYYSGGQWPKWADGGGSSMELIDPNSDNSLPSNWADSNESGKSAWTTVERRGILDNGSTNFPPTNPSRNLHVLLLDGGEALMDNISVIPDGGTNIVKNPGLEAGLSGWLAIGTHDETTIDPGAGPDGSAALHIRAAERGDTAGNRIRAQLTQPLTNGSIVTLKADVKWLHGTPEFLLRVHGNYLELPGVMTVPKNLGSPGAPNSVLRPNTGPSIVHVSPSPVLPMANQNVTISAQITDPDQIALAILYYRVDPGTNYSSVTMAYNGAGFYSASVPGQSNGVMVAFYIEALDSRGATMRFPADAPEKEGLILFGDSLLSGNFSTYRVWMSDKNIQRWNQRVQSSNKNLDATFVYNNERVVYDMGTKYSGSPFHWQGYNGPLGKSANYSLTFPSDDLFLGQSDFVLNLPSNIASDGTGVREQVFFWMASQVNQPYNYRRYTHFVLNGFDRDVVGGTPSIYEDAQQPNNDMVEEWFPNDPDGDLFKIEDWFEFTDSFQMFNQDSELKAVVTTNLVTGLPEYKKERYRWWFRKRAVSDSAHDYSELFRLVSAVNNPDPAIFVAQTEALIDIDEWMGAIALRHAAGDWDSFGYRRGKNMYAYKPQNGKWNLMHWDVAFAFGLGDGTTADLFDTVHFDGSVDTVTKRMMETAPFRRAYFRALYNIVNGPFLATRVGPVIDAKYNALISNGVPASSPQSVKDWIENRRQAILAQLASVSAGFTITSNNGNNYSTNRNTVILSGTAPVNVKSIRINGVEYPLTWTSVNTWQATVALHSQQNVLSIQGYDLSGNLIADASDSITINVSNSGDSLPGRVLISEINYAPGQPQSQFVEIFNSSRTTSFDLTGFRLNGTGFTFPSGSVIQPGGFLVVAKDAAGFGDQFGYTVPLAGIFSGNLDNNGETLSLIGPDQTGTNDLVYSAVRYGNVLPWSDLANSPGTSLQLIDPSQDATRVGNWSAISGASTPGATNSTLATLTAFPLVWVNEVQASNLNGKTDSRGDRDPWVELYNSSSSAISLAGLYLTDNYSNLTQWAFPSGASIAPGQHLIVWVDGEPAESTATEWHTSFRLNSTAGAIALVGMQSGRPVVFDYLNYSGIPAGQSYGAYPEGQAVNRELFSTATPGAANTLAAPPLQVFINEWMASNSSTVQDPSDNNFDDWFELFNAGSQPADLSGYTLTSDLLKPAMFTIPSGTIIPARGFLLVWADEDSATNGQLHVNFKLSANGESIGLFSPDGTQIDAVTFGAQTKDVSMGRIPDGGAIQVLAIATPGASNAGSDPNALQFTGLNVAAGNITLTWKSESGAVYKIQYKTNIGDAQWTDLRTVTASGSSASTTDSITGGHRFYRIVKQ